MWNRCGTRKPQKYRRRRQDFGLGAFFICSRKVTIAGRFLCFFSLDSKGDSNIRIYYYFIERTLFSHSLLEISISKGNEGVIKIGIKIIQFKTLTNNRSPSYNIYVLGGKVDFFKPLQPSLFLIHYI